MVISISLIFYPSSPVVSCKMYEILQYTSLKAVSQNEVFLSDSEPEISSSAALTSTKLSGFITFYIQTVFTEGFVHNIIQSLNYRTFYS